MRTNRALFFIIAFSLTAVLGAQQAKPILRIRPFTGDGISASEFVAVQSLVTSYIVELKAFRVIDSNGQELALKEAETAVNLGVPKDIAPLSADYIVTGSISQVGGIFVFSLDVTKVATGEKKNVADTLPSMRELLLASRRLTRTLFEVPDIQAPAVVSASNTGSTGFATSTPSATVTPVPATSTEGSPGTTGSTSSVAPPATAPTLVAMANPSLAKVAGTWKGDKGVDRINLFPDGRGIAVLSSGTTMKIRVTIRGNEIEIVQDQPNSPDFYRSTGMDFKTAKTVASQARPWKWLFKLTEDSQSLFGTKESIFVRAEANGKVSVDNGYIREAVWTRLSR